MRLRDVLGDIAALLSLLVGCYGLLVIGYALAG